MALDRLVLILDHQEGQAIIDALEDSADSLRRLADQGSPEQAARWNDKADHLEALALTVNVERIASGGIA